MIKKNLKLHFAALLIVLGFVAGSFAQSNFSNVSIKNFGQMDERFYRGAQPKKDEYQQLKALGIQTVIDLQEEPTSYEKSTVEALGMKYVNIPMVDKEYPKAEYIDQFLRLANDPATGVFYVHCARGRHRTGAAGAAYRFTKYHWSYDQVYSEMKKYDFYTSWGHGDFKTFVQDYASKTSSNQTKLSNIQVRKGEF